MVPPRPKKRRAYHHGNLRPALIRIALKMIGEKGPEGFTLRDIARRAGVSPGAPYRHFKDKEELLAAVAADCAEQISESMLEAVKNVDSDDLLERFRATGIAYVRFAVTHPEHFRVMNLPGMSARIPKAQRAASDEWKKSEREHLLRAQQRGQLANLPIDEVLLAAFCIVHGLAHAIVEGQEGYRNVDVKTATKLATIATGVLGCGLVPREQGLPIDPRRGKART